MPLHHPPSISQRTGAVQRGRPPSGAQAQGTLARWYDASGDVAPGVHATPGGTGAAPATAPEAARVAQTSVVTLAPATQPIPPATRGLAGAQCQTEFRPWSRSRHTTARAAPEPAKSSLLPTAAACAARTGYWCRAAIRGSAQAAIVLRGQNHSLVASMHSDVLRTFLADAAHQLAKAGLDALQKQLIRTSGRRAVRSDQPAITSALNRSGSASNSALLPEYAIRPRFSTSAVCVTCNASLADCSTRITVNASSRINRPMLSSSD